MYNIYMIMVLEGKLMGEMVGKPHFQFLYQTTVQMASQELNDFN